VDKELGIHKCGNKHLRWFLVEAAIPAMRTDLALKNLYDRVLTARGMNSGRKIANVAVARKLAAIVYRILIEEREYAPR
jgi:transposase